MGKRYRKSQFIQRFFLRKILVKKLLHLINKPELRILYTAAVMKFNIIVNYVRNNKILSHKK